MASTTITADSANCRLTSVSTTDYATCVDGDSLSRGVQGFIGQINSGGFLYTCYESFLAFDTTSLPPNITVTSADLKLYVSNDSSTTDFTIQAREYAYTEPLAVASWRDSTETPNDTLLASLSTSGISTGWITLTENTNFLQSIVNNTIAGNKTKLYIISSRQVASTEPTSGVSETVTFDGPSESNPPELVITYTKNNHMMNMGSVV